VTAFIFARCGAWRGHFRGHGGGTGRRRRARRWRGRWRRPRPARLLSGPAICVLHRRARRTHRVASAVSVGACGAGLAAGDRALAFAGVDVVLATVVTRHAGHTHVWRGPHVAKRADWAARVVAALVALGRGVWRGGLCGSWGGAGCRRSSGRRRGRRRGAHHTRHLPGDAARIVRRSARGARCAARAGREGVRGARHAAAD